MDQKLHNFLRELKTHRGSLTRQEQRTLRGQAIAGDIDGANRGLDKILKMREEKQK